MRILPAISLVALFAISSCATKDDQQPSVAADTNAKPAPERIEMRPMPGPDGGQVFVYQYSKQAIDSLLKLPMQDRPQTHEMAINYHLTPPPKVNFFPHLLPAKDVTLVTASPTAAVYTFVSQNTNERATLELMRIGSGSDSMWVVQQFAFKPNPEAGRAPAKR
jgi:hypothetical protein